MRQIQAVLIAVALLVGLNVMGAPSAGAQPAPTAPAATSRVNLTVEQRHIIKEVVKELKLPAVDGDVPLQAGAKVPPDMRRRCRK
jgi:hypothetical protein